MNGRLQRFLLAQQDVALLLREHKARSVLTILGISVGIWALVTLLSVGLGARQYIQGQVGKLGTDLLIVTPGNANNVATFFNRTIQESLTVADARAIRDQVPGVALVAPTLQLQGEISYRDRKSGGSLVGATMEYFAVRDVRLAYGRLLTSADEQAQSNVVVLGSEIANRLFSNRNPLGETIRFQNINLQVVGVLRNKNDSGAGGGRDSEIIVPLPTLQNRIAGVKHVQMIFVKPRDVAMKDRIKLEMELVLLSMHTALATQGLPYTVTDLGQLASIADTLVSAMTAFLVSIAAVSLIVGGIGVMNVMLASVRERISEVGIRRAVGATDRDIRSQFLIEAATLTAIGGIVGLLAAGLSLTILGYLMPWKPVLNPLAIVSIFLISGAIGVFFGYYPARMASQLTPMEALRYE
ncbi:MAG: FtsX-like permease family protein [Zoogloea sp.]|nr:FtsX-like permease family protein [Zoogloea sp.]